MSYASKRRSILVVKPPISLWFFFMLMLLPLCQLEASWFTKDEKPKEMVHRRLNEEQGQRFVSLVRLRSNIAEELTVFKRVQVEKNREIEGYNVRFVKDYLMIPELSYRYDPSSNALFRISEEAVAGATNRVETFVRIVEPEHRTPILRDMLGKTLATQQLQALALLEREKNQEHQLVNNVLLKEFEIDPDVRYRYDDDKRIVYKTVKALPPPVKPPKAVKPPPPPKPPKAVMPPAPSKPSSSSTPVKPPVRLKP